MKRQISIYLILFAFLLCSCGQASVGTASSGDSQQTTWEEQYDLGLRYLSDGNYEEAIIAFTAAIEIDPKRAPAYVGRGDAYSGVGQKLSGQAGDAELPAEAVSSYESAVADYLAALDLDESTAEVYRKAAEVYVTLGDLDSAVALLERGVSATGDEDLQTYLDELRASIDYVIQWKDPEFERMVRMAIDKPTGEILRSELDGVNSLIIWGDQYAGMKWPEDGGHSLIRASGTLLAYYTIGSTRYTEKGNIFSIEDVVHFRNLTDFEIIANHVNDLTPLLSLKHLQSVHVWANDIEDLSVLDQLDVAIDGFSNQQFVEIGDNIIALLQ